MTEPARSATGRGSEPARLARVSMIWAQAHGRVIGADGGLPWHLPEDLALFRGLTMGSTVVMGRRTWESLPDRFRPLPGRTNVVLTSDRAWAAEGARPAASVEEVLSADEDVWVIGGGAVYGAFLPYAHRIVVTDVDLPVLGDTFAPPLDDGWRRISRTPAEGWSTSASAGLRYAVTEYGRESVPPAG